MDRDEALRLLRGGEEGVAEWNRRRGVGEEIPDLDQEDFRDANLGGANLSGAHLFGAWLDNADLSAADLSEANLSKASLYDANLVEADLKDANLRGANLSGAVLSGAILSGADLSWANLVRVDLREANLSMANLARANLSDANLGDAILRMADLSGADLGWANFRGANVREANLAGAIMYQTVVPEQLGSALGQNEVSHHGPSSVSIAALRSFKNVIPEAFLRGCGLTNDEIEFAETKLDSIVQFYSCFISYSSGKEEPIFETRLHNDLQAKGVRCWFAPHDMEGGDKTRAQINTAIRLHERLLLVLSPKSMASDWVAYEISRARKRELKEKCRVLYPVSLVPYEDLAEWECLDPDTGEDLAEEIREYFIPDFSDWEDSAKYGDQFDRLLKSLQPKEAQQA